MNSNNRESVSDSNCSEYFAQISPAGLIECNEFSFKNILEMKKKQINLQNQKIVHCLAAVKILID